MFVEAPVALDPQKAMLQPTAGKVILKFLDDETRQLRIKFGQVIQEPGQVLFDGGIGVRFLRFVSPVASEVDCAIQPGLPVD